MNTNFNKNTMTQEHFETKQAEVSDTELINTIETKLSKLCKTGGRSLSMSIPPQVSDIDMAICELIRRYKQLLLHDVSKSFALGKTVVVNRCIYGHEFNLGETVDIIDYEPSQTTSWLCSNGKNQWWLSEDEANVC